MRLMPKHKNLENFSPNPTIVEKKKQIKFASLLKIKPKNILVADDGCPYLVYDRNRLSQKENLGK